MLSATDRSSRIIEALVLSTESMMESKTQASEESAEESVEASSTRLDNVSKLEPQTTVSSNRPEEGDPSETPVEKVQPEAAESSDSTRSGVPAWLFLVTLLVFAGLVGWQFQVKGQLEGQIAGLESELRDTQSLLGAHKSRLGEIRSGVRSLSDQLGGLLLLVEADPSDGVSLESNGSEDLKAESSNEAAIAPERRREIPARLGR